MSKSSYTPEFRAKIAQEYLNGNCSRKDWIYVNTLNTKS